MTRDGAGPVGARFDDLGPGGASFVLADPRAVFTARTPEEVRPVLRAAEAAARDGCWVAGFVGYEAAPGLDPSLPALGWPAGHPLAGLPLAWFASFGARHAVPPCSAPDPAARPLELRPDRGRDWHHEAVRAARDGIARGEYYQLNLTTRLTGTLPDAEAAHRALAAAQSGRHHALLSTGAHTVVSASPELFFERRGGTITTRPMKGTARRGRWRAEDIGRAAALRASPKERAENVMIVDLLRNDLARIARTGSVAVPALFELERYPTVWQLTSTVTARPVADTGLAEIFAALFPCGSVTGAPKRSAMRAIAELEGRPRGVYCGAVGYLEPDPVTPPARFSVAIRTLTRVEPDGYAEYGTGGAITWSSEPDAEWAELVAKTAVLSAAPPPRQLIETLRYDPVRGLVNGERHRARLSGSARHFGFHHHPADVAGALARAVSGRTEPGRVRLVLTSDGAVDVTVAPLAELTGPVRLALAATPVDSADVLLFHKHGDRARYDRWRAGRPDADDVVLWNERDEVTETTIANLAVRLAGRWWTPPLDCGLLPGVERQRLLDTGVLAERVIGRAELPGAELATLSSLRGWRPAHLT